MTPQNKGREWESIWATKISGNSVPGSGNKFYNLLDVRGKRITWSCKWTESPSIVLYRSTLSEAIDSVDGPGGMGTNRMPGLAIRLEGYEDFVILRADDFLELMTEKPIIPADKAAIRRAAARIPELLKDNDQS